MSKNNKLIDTLIVGIFSFLFWLGGNSWLPARRFIAPSIMMPWCVYVTHNWWCLTMWFCMPCFCLGYGDNSPLRHIFGDLWGRCIWSLLAAITLSAALFMTGHLSWYWFLVYLVINFSFEGLLKDDKTWIADPIIGIGFSYLVFMIH